MAGSGHVFWTGDPTTPANCILNGTNVSAINAANVGGAHRINGFAVQSSGAYTNDPLCGVSVSGTGTVVVLDNIQWNTCNGSHLAVSQAAVASIGSKQIINGGAQGGNPGMPQGWHIFCVDGAIIQVPTGALPSLSILTSSGGGNGGGFILASVLAFTEVVYSSISGATNWGGYKYTANANAIMSAGGGGPNYYPGSIAGTQGNGGQYF
jgi:hypothetical protein